MSSSDARRRGPSRRATERVSKPRGSATAFSFYANKTMTTGEGGMLVTDDEALAQRARTMRLHGIDRDVFDRFTNRRASWAYDVVAPGFKYNLTDTSPQLLAKKI